MVLNIVCGCSVSVCLRFILGIFGSVVLVVLLMN